MAKASAAASTLEVEAWAKAWALVEAKGDVRVGLPAASQHSTHMLVEMCQHHNIPHHMMPQAINMQAAHSSVARTVHATQLGGIPDTCMLQILSGKAHL